MSELNLSLPFAPTVARGASRRVIKRLLSVLLSAACLSMLIWVGWLCFEWAFWNATVSSDARQAECVAGGGACWSVIVNRWRLIFFGLYPFEEHWRSVAACSIIVVTVILSCVPALWTATRLGILWLVGFASFYILMRGGLFGLSLIREEQWGGLSLTLFIFSASVLIGMPLAVVLALLRDTKLPWISKPTGLIIDTIRSLPLLSILFAFAVVLPFMLPDMMVGEKLYRVIVAYALYFAAYQAEIIRGGLQGVPKGQDEAAKAMGMSYRHRMAYVLLPQAFRTSLPATINQFVVAFMETSLVVVVGFFDLLASGNAAYRTAEWTFAFVEVYAFIAAIYFIFSFGLSQYGAYLERRMGLGKR